MRRRMEFSKIIILAVSAFALGITVFSCWMIWRTNDLSPLAYLIPSVFTEAATGTAFYYRKAEAENVIKIQGGMTGGNPGAADSEQPTASGDNPDQRHYS